MRGLVLNTCGRNTEALENARRGLRCNLRSHVCWHVFGLIHRTNGYESRVAPLDVLTSDSDYNEAIKCYTRALSIDTENINILRDLSNLQIQMRDLKGYALSTQQMLAKRGTLKTNWFAFAVAHHLNKNYDLAINVRPPLITTDAAM